MKPCPFCGLEPPSEAFTCYVDGGPPTKTWAIFCRRCHARGPVASGSGAAIKAWNLMYSQSIDPPSPAGLASVEPLPGAPEAARAEDPPTPRPRPDQIAEAFQMLGYRSDSPYILEDMAAAERIAAAGIRGAARTSAAMVTDPDGTIVGSGPSINRTTTTHCLHETDVFLAVDPPTMTQKCCRCGAVYQLPGIRTRDPEHGPFWPVDRINYPPAVGECPAPRP